MNIRNRLTNCYAINDSKEAAIILEAILDTLTKGFNSLRVIPIGELKQLPKDEQERLEKITLRVRG